MIVGLFAEGRGDLAVITNILKGWLNIDKADIKPQIPEFDFDQTDLSVMSEEQFSNWTIIKKEAQERKKIDAFFNSPIEQESFVVLHLDTAERHLIGYGVTQPTKKTGLDLKEYCCQVRVNVIDKINEWLENSYQDKIAYAIAIEETDAWILTIHEDGKKDTSIYLDSKKRLNDVLNRRLKPKEKNILWSKKTFGEYDLKSSDFRKKKKLSACASKNESLKLFCESLDAFKPASES